MAAGRLAGLKVSRGRKGREGASDISVHGVKFTLERTTAGFGAGSPASQEPEAHLSRHAMVVEIEELLRVRDQQCHLREHHGRLQTGGRLSSPALPPQAGVQGTNPSPHCACPPVSSDTARGILVVHC